MPLFDPAEQPIYGAAVYYLSKKMSYPEVLEQLQSEAKFSWATSQQLRGIINEAVSAREILQEMLGTQADTPFELYAMASSSQRFPIGLRVSIAWDIGVGSPVVTSVVLNAALGLSSVDVLDQVRSMILSGQIPVPRYVQGYLGEPTLSVYQLLRGGYSNAGFEIG